ncbi:MAG TPA: radical SAM protein [Candidatus Udaeobacter sp.]|nr:radical SAM protein [Candidatus Udaeobacter sp.]
MRSAYRLEPCRSALNRVSGMPFKWSLNPYMGCGHRCTFCYVRAFERRADRPSDDRYGEVVRVKTNIADVLRFELSRPSWMREGVAIGAATDPYQPAEGRFRLTRACIEALGDGRTPFSIITRGPLIVRDLDVLTRAATRAEVSVCFSVPTLDEHVWRTTEPGTPRPEARLKALSRLVAAGIHARVLMAPILPGLSDRPDQLAAVIRAARAAGATGIGAHLLYLRPGTREHFLDHLERDWPEERERYEKLYAGRAYLPARETEPLRLRVAELRRQEGIADRRTVKLHPPEEPEQLELTIG